MGYFIEFHKKGIIPNENLEIDLYLPEIGTIIEVDGPSHFLPIWGPEKLHKQIKADSHKTGLILSKGFVIIRVKSFGNFVSLSGKEKLLTTLGNQLKQIKKKFPTQPNRYIEIEL